MDNLENSILNHLLVKVLDGVAIEDAWIEVFASISNIACNARTEGRAKLYDKVIELSGYCMDEIYSTKEDNV